VSESTEEPTPEYAVVTDVSMGEDVDVYDQVNLYDCEIGDGTKIDAYVYVEAGVKIGSDCTIRPFTFIPTGVTIADEVFVGPQVTFTNDKHPSIHGEWELLETAVEEGAAIGADATIGPGVEIGADATVGAGAVVLNDVPPGTTVVGNPAKPIDE
jgi:acetyltransferase-like isoleucine patch superfamily enzyme